MNKGNHESEFIHSFLDAETALRSNNFDSTVMILKGAIKQWETEEEKLDRLSKGLSI